MKHLTKWRPHTFFQQNCWTWSGQWRLTEHFGETNTLPIIKPEPSLSAIIIQTSQDILGFCSFPPCWQNCDDTFGVWLFITISGHQQQSVSCAQRRLHPHIKWKLYFQHCLHCAVFSVVLWRERETREENRGEGGATVQNGHELNRRGLNFRRKKMKIFMYLEYCYSQSLFLVLLWIFVVGMMLYKSTLNIITLQGVVCWVGVSIVNVAC